MGIDNQKLKAELIKADLLNRTDIEEAWQEAEKKNQPFFDVMVDKDLISDEHLGQIAADTLNVEFVNLRKKKISTDCLRLIPEIMARSQLVIPFDINKEGVSLALNDPSNLEVVRLIEKKSGQRVMPYYATERDIKQVLVRYRKSLVDELQEFIKQGLAGNKKDDNGSVIKIVDIIIRNAYENRASDIHIEPTEKEIIIRFRMDGILQEVLALPKELLEEIITRIKILAKLRTDEHRAAQDGKMIVNVGEEDLDIRVSVIPIINGEKVVMRLLAEKTRQFILDDLGFSPADIEKVHQTINRPHGMILVTGPTGSGKTTTLYALLKIVNKKEVNISTIEDPVEYNIPGINQIQVNPKTNLTFASGLRSIVRQDPDIIMVGEIRDEDTASIAINAALTGHLVLSTLHTNDAATALPRLLDMKIEPFLVASTVNVIIAQRLVRRICTQCLMSEVLSGEQLDNLKSQIDLEAVTGKKNTLLKELRFYRGKGCQICNFTGYSGRIGVFEVLPVSEAIRKLITGKADADELQKKAIAEGMKTMFTDGISKALQGQTTIEEVLKVTVS
jgi:type IV pilus assembly protein PilB